jgi:hypothetical protein
MKIFVKKYNFTYKDRWDKFLDNAKNATFLFKRDFMDYHQDRFVDFSVMVIENEKIVAVLPANLLKNKTVVTHSGLSYGGVVVGPEVSVNKSILYFKEILKFIYRSGSNKLLYKQLPDFYSKCSQSELEYALYLVESIIVRVDTAFLIDYRNKFKRKMPKGRKYEINKAKKLNVSIVESKHFNKFWQDILEPNLKQRFMVKPVHSLEEISLLKENNYKNIHQFNAFLGNIIIAGATIFETDTTAHVQYIAGNDLARQSGAIDFLFSYLINYFADSKLYFDFGTVNENSGKKINYGLMKWKESFGSRVFLHKFYEIDTVKYVNIESDNYFN